MNDFGPTEVSIPQREPREPGEPGEPGDAREPRQAGEQRDGRKEREPGALREQRELRDGREPRTRGPRRLREQDPGREHRRRRIRRHGRRAYIRSVYFLPSMATLGNAVCGFGAMYVAAFDTTNVGYDPWARALLASKFLAAAYLVFAAMIFDALDGRLARFTRHTTDFGGQLDSLADVVSFGAAPAFIALMVFKEQGPTIPFALSRLIWGIGAVYFSCAAMRLARFNVSNEHGEQHHFSFLGLPSPGAAGAVAAFILMQQDLRHWTLDYWGWTDDLATLCVYLLPAVVLVTGLLMVSNVRYPHVVNRWLRGRKSFPKLVAGVMIIVLMIVAHRYVLGIGCLSYALYGPAITAYLRFRPRPVT